jgi:CRISPR-associated protein Csx3
MAAYKIEIVGGILKVGFGQPAQNDQIVKDAETRLDEMIANGELAGGKVLRVNGPASLPVAMVIAHSVGHLYGAIACFDPKLSKYVVAISHSPTYFVGELID